MCTVTIVMDRITKNYITRISTVSAKATLVNAKRISVH
jgi:hypothetical protein